MENPNAPIRIIAFMPHMFDYINIKILSRRVFKINNFGKLLLAVFILSAPFLIKTFLTPQELILEPPEAKQELVIIPETQEEAILDFINTARETVDLQIYLLTNKEIIAALEEAEKRGVEVRILLEHNPYGGAYKLKDTVAKLEQAGVEVKDTSPLFPLTHTKMLIADNKRALILTANLTFSGLNKDRDFGVIDEDPSDLSELTSLFDADWEAEFFWPRDPELVISPNNSRWKIESLIKKAESELLIAAEVFSDEGILSLVAEAAKRGVRVKTLLASAKEIDVNEDAKNYLEKTGAEVRYLKKPFLHTKLIIVDQEAMYLGSINFTAQSLNENREVGILTIDPEIIQKVIQIFNKDWG